MMLRSQERVQQGIVRIDLRSSSCGIGGLAGAGKAGGREAGRGDKQSWPGVQATKQQKLELLRY